MKNTEKQNADHLDVRQQRQQAAHALADQGLVVDQEDADHGDVDGVGIQPETRKPRPKVLSKSI